MLGPKQRLQRNFGKAKGQKKSKSQINNETCMNETCTGALINVTCHIQRQGSKGGCKGDSRDNLGKSFAFRIGFAYSSLKGR